MKTIEYLETIHIEQLDQGDEQITTNNNQPIIMVDEYKIISEKIMKQQQTNHRIGSVTYYLPFLKPSNQKECEKTKYRLQIYHPSYTVHVINNYGCVEDFVGGLASYLIEQWNFTMIEDDENGIIVECEILKSSFVKSLREKLSIKVNQMLDCGKSVNDGITNIIDTEFKPYSTKNQQCLINFYERFTLRLVLKRRNLIPNSFVLAGQVFQLYNGAISQHTGLDSLSISNYSDRVIGIKSMTDHFGNTPETVCDLMLCMILQHTMPKYYFENYRIPENLEPAKYLALVDVFYYEMLSAKNSQSNSIPVFLTQNYFNSPFELFKYGLEMSFDLLYNQLSTRKKIELVEKLVKTYLNQEITPEYLKIIHSESHLKSSDIKSKKYISTTRGNKTITFVIVCLENVTTVTLTNVDERVKTVTTKLMEYTLQFPNLLNGNTVERIKMSSRYLNKPIMNTKDTTTSLSPLTSNQNNFCNLL